MLLPREILPTALSGIAFIIIIAVDQIAHRAATPCSLSLGAESEQRSSTYSLDCKKVVDVGGKTVCLCKGRQKWALYHSMVFLKCRYLGQGNHQLASTEDLARERMTSKDATEALMGSPLHTMSEIF